MGETGNMSSEETKNRNEAIVKMLGYKIYPDKAFIPDLITHIKRSKVPLYHKDWNLLMPAYLLIKSLGYHGTIEDLGKPGHRVYFTDKNFKPVGTGNRDEDLRTAIWLTVSDFAIEFNKNKYGK